MSIEIEGNPGRERVGRPGRLSEGRGKSKLNEGIGMLIAIDGSPGNDSVGSPGRVIVGKSHTAEKERNKEN